MTFKQLKKLVKSSGGYFLLSYTGEIPGLYNFNQVISLDEVEDIPEAIINYEYGYIYLYSCRDHLVGEATKLLNNLDPRWNGDPFKFLEVNSDAFQAIITSSILTDTIEYLKPMLKKIPETFNEWASNEGNTKVLNALAWGDNKNGIKEFIDMLRKDYNINDCIDIAGKSIKAIIR